MYTIIYTISIYTEWGSVNRNDVNTEMQPYNTIFYFYFTYNTIKMS